MCKVLKLTILVYMNTLGMLGSARLPSVRAPIYPFGTKKPAEYSCVLPPYPADGSYVVVDVPSARPGDSFQKVTLVRYKTEEENQLTEVNALACSYGEWFEILEQNHNEYLYFNRSVCMALCLGTLTDPPFVPSTVNPAVTKKSEPKQNLCKAPPNPPNVRHRVTHKVTGQSGEEYEALYLSYTCTRALTMVGKPSTYCFDGIWSSEPPKCITNPPPLSANSGTIMEDWEKDFNCYAPRQPKDGAYTVVNNLSIKAGERNREAHLYYTCNPGTKLIGPRDVYCISGDWSSKSPKCVRCGHVSDVVQSTVVTPWHVGVYNKSSNLYICGGSIIATNLILSAAHCFWSEAEGLTAASRFAVAAGKVYAKWDDSRDGFAQKSDVDDIAIPPRYRGRRTKFQDDIALLFLTSPLDYNEYVVPLCLDFGAILDEQQMKPGNVGRVVLNDGNSDGSPNFQIKNFTFMDIGECIAAASLDTLAYVTSDKMCAWVIQDTSLCRRDSGSGLAVPIVDENNNSVTYYLRGVLVPPSAGDEPCGYSPIATFTDISAHAQFLKLYFDLALW